MGGGRSGPGLSAASHARNFHFPAEGVGLQPAAPSPPAILSPRKDGAAGSPRRAGKGFPRPGREIRPLPPTPRRGTGSAPAATPPRRAPRGAAGESPPSSSPPRCQPLGVTAPGRGERGGGVKGGGNGLLVVPEDLIGDPAVEHALVRPQVGGGLLPHEGLSVQQRHRPVPFSPRCAGTRGERRRREAVSAGPARPSPAGAGEGTAESGGTAGSGGGLLCA